jgi:hypothetical protein
MWLVAGVLLGLVAVGAALGLHVGAHAHLAAAALGVLAAIWLVAMAVSGHPSTALWALLVADGVVSLGVGVPAARAIRRDRRMPPQGVGGVTDADNRRSVPRRSGGAGHLEGAEGVAIGRLDPTGIVLVAGEQWSAVSVNGTVPAGARVQVLTGGVRLEVWGEVTEDAGGGSSPSFDLPPVSAAAGVTGTASTPSVGPNGASSEGAVGQVAGPADRAGRLDHPVRGDAVGGGGPPSGATAGSPSEGAGDGPRRPEEHRP